MTEHYPLDDHADARSLLVAAAYVILRRDDEVFVQRRAGTGYRDGYWAVVAGHVDPGESVHEAAVREALEEAGVTIAPDDLRPVTAIHRFERGGPQVEQRIDLFFEVTRWSGDAAHLEADKAAEAGWYPLSALPEPFVPHERDVLDLLAAGTPVPPVISLPM